MKKVLALLALLGTGGCSHVVGVWALAASPDGTNVVVVGKQIDKFLASVIQERPVRWVCTRAANGMLDCVPDVTALPGGGLVTIPGT